MRQSGHTLLELLVTLTLIAILLLIGLSLLSRLLAELRLDMATFELSQHWKFTRFDAMGSGTTPTALCMKDDGRIEVAKIAGDRDLSEARFRVSHGTVLTKRFSYLLRATFYPDKLF